MSDTDRSKTVLPRVYVDMDDRNDVLPVGHDRFFECRSCDWKGNGVDLLAGKSRPEVMRDRFECPECRTRVQMDKVRDPHIEAHRE